MMVIFSSCNKEEEITTVLPPAIKLVDYDGKYTVKQGAKLTIAPEYESVEGALYSWTIDGKEIGNNRFLIYSWNETGTQIVSLEVTTDYGKAQKNIRIEVVELEIPFVTLPDADKGYTLSVGAELTFLPVVKETTLEQKYTWQLDGKKVSDEKNYTFKSERKGKYNLKFVASTSDGSDEIQFEVEVMELSDLPFSWTFEKEVYNYAKGRTIKISPLTLSKTEGVNFIWKMDGEEVQNGNKSYWLCAVDKEGKHQLEVIASLTSNGKNVWVSHQLEVNVCPAEGQYKRAVAAASAADFNEVYEYLPAPGQFINENYNAVSAADAIAKAKEKLTKKQYVSLGGFGGYIVLGFDHSIDNGTGHDFGVYGNAYDGSSEPGIVWVMQDENGDGKPNDTWYELKGSETGKAETRQNYSVTYYRPSAPGMDVQWKDSEGQTGTIDYIKDMHKQDYYYPTWLETDSYTLYGTCLKARNYDQSGDGSYWVQPAYDWGYADNYSATDHIANKGKIKGKANLFDIDNAIGHDGKTVKLKYIDFVKVQNGVNSKSGWLGELSTEVFGCFDYSLMK